MSDEINDAGFTQAANFFAMGPRGEMEADKSLGVTFYTMEEEDSVQTVKQGHPVFRTVECVRIQVPGEKEPRGGRVKSVYPDPRLRFRAQYERFKAGQTRQIVGQPLNQWGLLTPARAKEYEYFGVYSVEQLAALADTSVQNIQGSLGDRQKARDFLEMARGQAPIAQARAEIEKLRLELAALRDETHTAAPPAVETSAPSNGAAPKRRGRPPGSKNKPPASEA